jgi:hypothetical protein
MLNLQKALKKGLATFIFSTGGLFIGVNIFDADVQFWKVIVSTGIGAIINMLYRWAESTLREPEGRE